MCERDTDGCLRGTNKNKKQQDLQHEQASVLAIKQAEAVATARAQKAREHISGRVGSYMIASNK